MVNIDPNIKIASFDVFDTAITRSMADPKGVFHLVAQEILHQKIDVPAELVENFLSFRVAAERSARKRNDSDDISIFQIYENLQKNFTLSEHVVGELIRIEIEQELKSFRVVKRTLALIRLLRERGCRIVFVSDMYLPVEVIRSTLKNYGLYLDGDGLYVSGEHGYAKKTGSLFRHVLACEGCAPSQIVHFGDNYRSDCLMARHAVQMQAHQVVDCHHSHYEKILKASNNDKFDVNAQLLAGASRLARLEVHEDFEPRQREFHKIGANVAGPILFGFIRWVLDAALKDNVKKLYFLSRDGEVMLQVAKEVASRLGIDLDLKYLYVSRQSLFAPSFFELNETEIDWILQKDPCLTMALVAERLSVVPLELQKMVVAAGFSVLGVDEDLTVRHIDQLKKIFKDNRDVREAFFRNSESLRENVAGYLRQEGLLSAENWAVVDSGWNGRLQHAMQSILSWSGWTGTTRGYYFGVLDKYDLNGQKEAFLFSPQRPDFKIWCRPFTFIFEMLTSATHGMTKAYSADMSGRYLPVLSESSCGPLAKDVEALRVGVDDFLRHLDMDRFVFDEAIYREKTFSLLKRLYLNPSKGESSALGAVPFAHDQTDSVLLPFAPPLPVKRVVAYALNMFTKDKYAQTFWLHGSRVQSAWLARQMLAVLGVFHFLFNAIYVKLKL